VVGSTSSKGFLVVSLYLINSVKFVRTLFTNALALLDMLLIGP